MGALDHDARRNSITLPACASRNSPATRKPLFSHSGFATQRRNMYHSLYEAHSQAWKVVLESRLGLDIGTDVGFGTEEAREVQPGTSA
jgi:hypothetical protein